MGQSQGIFHYLKNSSKGNITVLVLVVIFTCVAVLSLGFSFSHKITKSNQLYKQKLQARHIALGVADKVLAKNNLEGQASSEGKLKKGTYSWSYSDNELKVTSEYKESIYTISIVKDDDGKIVSWTEY
ncbi:hypothetical protein PRVXH_001890 [Proteinivorax hydrogeniformans]|uniref:Uncharacterized protein n=1 Tax=Proteinivorax hydrogeniformans TaxID=1826727 RepID=A0AAU8HQZ6_9FIRM